MILLHQFDCGYLLQEKAENIENCIHVYKYNVMVGRWSQKQDMEQLLFGIYGAKTSKSFSLSQDL